MTFYSGALFPEWQGDLFVAALVGKHVARLVLNGDRVVAEERLLADLNTRIRDVREGPDQALYVMTDGMDGRILRLVPRAQSASRASARGRIQRPTALADLNVDQLPLPEGVAAPLRPLK
jgi:hypothetical protein